MTEDSAQVDDVKTGNISQFIDRHYRHFNAAVLKDAADAYIAHLERGGKMMITLAGAMSTAELGVSLAEMIRQDKVHAITCTGANLEEDLFNLVARSEYERIPELSGIESASRRGAFTPPFKPRYRYLHSGRRGNPPDREVGHRRMGRCRQKKGAVFPARISLQNFAGMPAQEIL